MKTDTEILNEIARKTSILRLLSEEECAQLKQTLLEMHNDIVSLCEEHKITIMLGGGSCLGAIRHNGFIPWDDDLDLMMPRSDYEKLISLYDKGFIDERFQFDYPNRCVDVKNTFLKIYLRGTTFLDIFDDKKSFANGIFIDVFPIDYAPENKLIRRCKALLSDGIQFICTCTLYSQYPSNILKLFYGQDKGAHKRYQMRCFLGKVFSIIPHRLWVYWFDKLNKNSKPSRLMTVPTGRKHYLSETLPSNVFTPTVECSFEGVKSYIPNDYHQYLSNLYGDYLKVPPEDKRERHFIIDIKFPS
jgi:lipopolysaccharide cholinephosphotransferase